MFELLSNEKVKKILIICLCFALLLVWLPAPKAEALAITAGVGAAILSLLGICGVSFATSGAAQDAVEAFADAHPSSVSWLNALIAGGSVLVMSAQEADSFAEFVQNVREFFGAEVGEAVIQYDAETSTVIDNSGNELSVINLTAIDAANYPSVVGTKIYRHPVNDITVSLGTNSLIFRGGSGFFEYRLGSSSYDSTLSTNTLENFYFTFGIFEGYLYICYGMDSSNYIYPLYNSQGSRSCFGLASEASLSFPESISIPYTNTAGYVEQLPADATIDLTENGTLSDIQNPDRTAPLESSPTAIAEQAGVVIPGSMVGEIALPSLGGLGPIFISKFPWCIPWDFVACVRAFSAAAAVPEFEVDLFDGVNWPGLNLPDTSMTLSLEQFSTLAALCRWVTTIMFCASLAFLTRKLLWR